MANYAQLSTGSYNYDDTKYAQELLNKNGYTLNTDGIYGKKTDAAVRDFQSKNGLTADGILGKNTWAKLLGTQTTNTSVPSTTTSAPTLPDYSQYAYNSAGDTAYQSTVSAADQAYADALSIQNPYPEYAQKLQGIYDQYANRDPFSYDLNADPMYQQYKDMYTQQGQLAMLDTMGQAAALTGGYGSSYGQSVGQQAYQSYLQQLGNLVPEFYGMALDRYNAQGDAIANQYSMMDSMAQNEFENYQVALNNAWQNADRLYNQAQDIYNRNSSNWYNSIQLGMDADSTAYTKQQNERDYLTGLISAGYDPTDAELTAAGMTPSQVQAIRNAYSGSSTGTTSSVSNYDNGSVSPENIKLMQKLLGVSVDGLWGNESSGAAGNISAAEAWNAYENDLLFPGGIVDPNSDAIKNFRNSLSPEEHHDAIARHMWGPYTAYLAYEIITDEELSEPEKDYLTEQYKIKESDYKYLEQKGKL